MSNSPWRRRETLAAALGVAVIVRGGLVWAGAVPFGGDEAVVALMGRHILRAGAHPFFFYGQAYFGSLIAWLAAGAFGLWGESVLSFRLVLAALYLGIVATTYCLTLRMYGSRWIAGVAALLVAVPTVLLTVYTSTSPGGYAETLLFGNIVLLLALKLGQARRFWGDGLLLGFFGGVGLWTFPMIVVYLVPALVYLTAQRWSEYRESVRAAHMELAAQTSNAVTLRLAVWAEASQRPAHEILRAGNGLRMTVVGGWARRWAGEAALIAAGGALGSAPWWWYSLANSWATMPALTQPTFGPTTASLGQALLHLAVFGPTVVLGLRPPWNVQMLALPLAPLAVALYLALLVFLSRKLRARNEAPWEARLLLAGVGLMVLSAFLLTPNKVDPTGRHLLALSVPAAIFMAEFLHSLNGRHPLLGRGLALGLVVFQGWGLVQCAVTMPPGLTAQLTETMQIDEQEVAAAASFLQAHGETRGFTTYWLAYPLDFLSREQVIFAGRLPYDASLQVSLHDTQVYPPYTDLVCQSSRIAYLTAHVPALDDRLRTGLGALGVAFQEHQIGDLHILYALSRKVTPDELGLGEACGEP